MKILIAEDNPIARKLLKAQLERVKLQVESTTNGEEAIAAWEKHGPGYFQAAMFDHHMPICDGVEAVRRIRALEVERGYHILLPIIALSADCQESTKQLCLNAGMDAFLSKPANKIELFNLLRRLASPRDTDVPVEMRTSP